MNKNNIEFVDFGHRLHMDTKQNIKYKDKDYSCIKGAVLHKKRTLKKNKKCYNFNYYWLENRKIIIKEIYREILKSNPFLIQELKTDKVFAYKDNENRNLGIGFHIINKVTNEIVWYGKNIMGEILMELKQEI